MEYTLFGSKIYPGRVIPIFAMEGEPLPSIKERFRLILIKSGTGRIEINGSILPYVAPIVLCIHEQELLQVYSEQKHTIKELVFHPAYISPSYTFECLRMTPDQFIASGVNEADWLHAFTERNHPYKGMISLGIATANRLDNLMAHTIDEAVTQKDYYWPCRTRSYLLELLLVIDRAYNDMSHESTFEIASDMDETYQVLEYLNNNYTDKIQLADLTDKFNINRTTLNANFKKMTGTPIMTYLIQLRMKMAMALLKDTKLQITEVMFRVGFTDNSHFLRMFKKHCGIAPSEYRDTYCWVND